MRDSLKVKIEKVRLETPIVKTLYFKRPFDFVAGQYISVYFDDLGVSEGKAYSLSSRPSDELASITVKNVGGPYSKRLCSLEAGDELEISQAYGYFNPETDSPLVGIAAGVGLGPIWSVLASNDSPKNTLYHTAKTDDDMVFRAELDALKTKVVRHVTQQKDTQFNSGRFKVEDIVKSSPDDAFYLCCGSIDFVKDIFRDLLNEGVDRERISTEVFFEQGSK